MESLWEAWIVAMTPGEKLSALRRLCSSAKQSVAATEDLGEPMPPGRGRSCPTAAARGNPLIELQDLQTTASWANEEPEAQPLPPLPESSGSPWESGEEEERHSGVLMARDYAVRPQIPPPGLENRRRTSVFDGFPVCRTSRPLAGRNMLSAPGTETKRHSA